MNRFRFNLTGACLFIGIFAGIELATGRVTRDTPIWAILWFAYLMLLYSIPNAGASRQFSGVIYIWPILAMSAIVAMQSLTHLSGGEADAKLGTFLRASLICSSLLTLLPAVRNGLGENQ